MIRFLVCALIACGGAPLRAAETPRPRLLLTAFEPFGVRTENASLDVLRRIRARYGDRFDFAVIPVSDDGEAYLRRRIAELQPAGVVSLGEDSRLPPDAVNLEPLAYDAPVTRGAMRAPGTEVRSPAAVAVARALGLELRSGIGLFFCNRVYLHGLRWAGDRRRPALFLHVSVRGDRDAIAGRVLRVIERISGRGP